MAEVVLKYPDSGDATLSVELPYPAHSQPIRVDTNQKEYRATSGDLWSCKVGPTIYQISRTFGLLSEAKVAELFAFLEGIGFFKKIRYCYMDATGGYMVDVPCRIIDAPTERVAHIGNRDVSLAFMQYIHPDRESEFLGAQVDALIDDQGNPLVDDQGNILVWGT